MLSTLMMVTIYLFLQMCFIWILYRRYSNPSIVDSAWSIGLMMAGIIYLSAGDITFRKIVVAALLVVWALRLSGYIYLTRLRHGHQDKRYTNISNQWKISQSAGFFLNFQLQALFILIIASGIFYFVGKSSIAAFTTIDYIAIGVILIAIIGESIADVQLQRFKKQYAGKVCNIGLWWYSRHPNYFFDWLTWCGFALFALQSEFGCFSLLSIVFLYIIFTRITGPLTERLSIQSRGQAYLDYQATTSMFVPWFKH